MSGIKVHMLRLEPGTEVKSFLEAYVAQRAPNGAAMMTCCGSVTKATLRFAIDSKGGTHKIKTYHQHFEVLSLSGPISRDGAHLHICLGDANGATVGGHVMGDLVVFTTLEVALCEAKELSLTRYYDPKTGHDQLAVSNTSTNE